MTIKIIDLREATNVQQAGWMVDLAEGLRPSDLDEMQATTELEPATALVASLMLSDHAWVVLSDGVPVAVFGCGPTDEPGKGTVWMMGTPLMDEPATARGILRATLPHIMQMHTAYPCLWNNIDARNLKSIRWLEWAGFSPFDVVPEHGLERRLFISYARHHPPCATPSPSPLP